MITTGNTCRFQNLENLSQYDFSFQTGDKRSGVSAMLRVKNEARKIRCCLTSLLGLFDEIVVVDNASVDGTLEIVRALKREHDHGDAMRIYDYPFSVARCGPEHDATPEDSVRSLAYYYNWTLSHCTRRYACKWDADMIVRREEHDTFRAFLKELDHQDSHAITLPGQTVYKDSSGRCYLSGDELVAEPRLFPFGCDNYYIKVDHYERIHLAPSLPIDSYSGGVVFYELKFVDEDEFSHWSTTQFPTARKQQEWERVELLRGGGPVGGRLIQLPANFLEDQCTERRA